MKIRSLLAGMLPFLAAMSANENKQAMANEPYLIKNTGYGNMGARMFINSSGPMYFPRHGKFKGYMRDNRNWGRKKKAA
jgi:hypothetical protein